MIQNLLSNIRREDFEQIASELMNNYCVLRHDSRNDGDVIFRFAEIEFYLYDASEQNNQASNLEWCTNTENQRHRIDVLKKDCKGISLYAKGSSLEENIARMRRSIEI